MVRYSFMFILLVLGLLVYQFGNYLSRKSRMTGNTGIVRLNPCNTLTDCYKQLIEVCDSGQEAYVYFFDPPDHSFGQCSKKGLEDADQ